MMELSFLKNYVCKTESDDMWNNKHVFLKVSESEIVETEEKLGIELPTELKKFYNEIGYGFLNCGKGSNINRVISPIEIYDFYTGINDYKDDIRREYYTNSDRLIFFEVSANTFITIDTSEVNDKGESPIYYFDKKVSESLYDFFINIDKEYNFYMKK